MQNTIDDLIQSGKSDPYNPNEISYKAVIKSSNGKTIIVPMLSFFDKYYDIIMNEFVEDMTMDDEEYAKYKYNPKALSYDMFDTVELWHPILRINNMSSIMQFNKKTIKMFTDEFIDVIDELINLEEDEKAKNDEDIKNNI